MPSEFSHVRAVRVSCGLASLALLMCAATAEAQAARKWEVEFHGGGTFAGNATGGQTTLPAPGDPFTTVNGRPSRRISSWYFGDGAKLLNEINGAFFVLGAPSFGRIVPLDPVLNAALAERRNGGSLGVRFARVINRRLKAEVSVDHNRGALEMSKDVAVAIETSRASFLTAWASLFGTGGGVFAAPSVASVIAIDEGSAHQVLTVGTLNINLASSGRFMPHATVGAGLLSNTGDAPGVTLSGRYQFAVGNVFPVNEKDTVTVRFTEAASSLVWVVGAGFTYDVFQRSGVRVDVRAHLSSNRGRTLISAHPEVLLLTPSIVLPSFTSPSIQFSNNPAAAARSTLSGPDIVDFEAFTGSGVHRHVGLTAGWYWRF